MARCAATPSTCERPNEVTAWTRVAAPAASASGTSICACCFPITSSIRYLEVAGRIMPAIRFTSMRQRPRMRRPRCEHQRFRLRPGVGVVDFFLFRGIVGADGQRGPAGAFTPAAPAHAAAPHGNHSTWDARTTPDVPTERAVGIADVEVADVAVLVEVQADVEAVVRRQVQLAEREVRGRIRLI